MCTIRNSKGEIFLKFWQGRDTKTSFIKEILRISFFKDTFSLGRRSVHCTSPHTHQKKRRKKHPCSFRHYTHEDLDFKESFGFNVCVFANLKCPKLDITNA